MNEWDEAVGKSIRDFYREQSLPQEHLGSVIDRNFKEIRATYEKLVELAALYNFKYNIHKQMAIGATTAQEAEEYNRRMTRLTELESDPLVQKAIEGSEK